MNKSIRARWLGVFLFVGLHLLSGRFLVDFPFFPDFLFLILAYTAMKNGYFKSYAAGCFIGWVTDYLSGGLIGVFGLSRVLAAALLHEMVRIVDLKRKGFVFFLVFFSLVISNSIAYIFFQIIEKATLPYSLIFWQPLATALFAVSLISWEKVRNILDIY